jgi:hypothetical protein
LLEELLPRLTAEGAKNADPRPWRPQRQVVIHRWHSTARFE